MSEEANIQQNDQNIDQGDLNIDQENAQMNDQSKDDSGIKSKTVPLKTFLDKKDELKTLKSRLNEYEDRDKKASEAKLLEENKLKELIQNKDEEINKLRDLLANEAKSRKKDKLENKFAQKLQSNNAINYEDALKFIDYNDLLDSEDDIDDEINNRVESLIKNKSYLFKINDSKRDSKENGTPSGDSQKSSQGNNNIKRDPIIDSLAQKLKIK